MALLDALEEKELELLEKVYDGAFDEQDDFPVANAVCCNCRPVEEREVVS